LYGKRYVLLVLMGSTIIGFLTNVFNATIDDFRVWCYMVYATRISLSTTNQGRFNSLVRDWHLGFTDHEMGAASDCRAFAVIIYELWRYVIDY